MINKLNYDILNEGVNYSVYAKYCDGDNLQDLLSNVFAKINEMIEDVNTYTECIKKTVEWITGNGLCTVIVDKLNIREKPSTSSKIVGSYTKGGKVYYDKIVDNEGYRWISWIGQSSGKRRFMAVRVLKNNKKYGSCV